MVQEDPPKTKRSQGVSTVCQLYLSFQKEFDKSQTMGFNNQLIDQMIFAYSHSTPYFGSELGEIRHVFQGISIFGGRAKLISHPPGLTKQPVTLRSSFGGPTIGLLLLQAAETWPGHHVVTTLV